MNFENKLEFKYTDYSHASVKYFLDCMHMIKPRPTDITIILEVLDLAHSEGKTTYDSFESYLSERLMCAILKESLSIGTEILIAAFLSKVDNLHQLYQQQLAGKLTQEFYSQLFCEFDMSSQLNSRLIEMCICKGIFEDSQHKTVVYTMMTFGKDLKQFYGLPSSFE